METTRLFHEIYQAIDPFVGDMKSLKAIEKIIHAVTKKIKKEKGITTKKDGLVKVPFKQLDVTSDELEELIRKDFQIKYDRKDVPVSRKEYRENCAKEICVDLDWKTRFLAQKRTFWIRLAKQMGFSKCDNMKKKDVLKMLLERNDLEKSYLELEKIAISQEEEEEQQA